VAVPPVESKRANPGICCKWAKRGFWRTEIPSGAQVWDLGVEVPQNLKQNVRLLYEYVSLIVACLTHLWLSFNF